MTLEEIRKIDPNGMFDDIHGFPKHLREGRTIALGVPLTVSMAGVRHVVIAGMGGSAIGGDLVRAFAGATSPVPISVVRGYDLPASVDDNTLFVACSYSGNTEETLSALDQALGAGARILCLAAGGRIAEIASARHLDLVTIPSGMQPRAALGYSFGALATVAERLGLLKTTDADWLEADRVLTMQSDRCARPSGNEALSIAESMIGRLPVVYSGSGLLEAVNLRWRCQINENSKALAYGNLFPELNHNEIMGWDDAGTLPCDLAVVVLRDPQDHPRVLRRMEITRGILTNRAARWTEVEGAGSSPLSRMLTLVNLGDWVSLYLAALTGVDPTPIGYINRLKQALS